MVSSRLRVTVSCQPFSCTRARNRHYLYETTVGAGLPIISTLHDLVHNVTGQNGFVTIEGLFNQMAKEVSAFNGVTWQSLGDTGVTVQI